MFVADDDVMRTGDRHATSRRGWECAQIDGSKNRKKPAIFLGFLHVPCYDSRMKNLRLPRSNFLDPNGRGLHPIGGVGVPHAGYGCKNCRQAPANDPGAASIFRRAHEERDHIRAAASAGVVNLVGDPLGTTGADLVLDLDKRLVGAVLRQQLGNSVLPSPIASGAVHAKHCEPADDIAEEHCAASSHRRAAYRAASTMQAVACG
jgi:hypothetical protein